MKIKTLQAKKSTPAQIENEKIMLTLIKRVNDKEKQLYRPNILSVKLRNALRRLEQKGAIKYYVSERVSGFYIKK